MHTDSYLTSIDGITTFAIKRPSSGIPVNYNPMQLIDTSFQNYREYCGMTFS